MKITFYCWEDQGVPPFPYENYTIKLLFDDPLTGSSIAYYFSLFILRTPAPHFKNNIYSQLGLTFGQVTNYTLPGIDDSLADISIQS
jgi:hypothetical protein